MILAKQGDIYPSGFDYTMYVKGVSIFNGIPYYYATFGPDHQKTFVGLMYTGLSAQGGQLASLGRTLASDHQGFLEAIIQDECYQHLDSTIIEGVQQFIVYSHPKPFLAATTHTNLLNARPKNLAA